MLYELIFLALLLIAQCLCEMRGEEEEGQTHTIGFSHVNNAWVPLAPSTQCLTVPSEQPKHDSEQSQFMSVHDEIQLLKYYSSFRKVQDSSESLVNGT